MAAPATDVNGQFHSEKPRKKPRKIALLSCLTIFILGYDVIGAYYAAGRQAPKVSWQGVKRVAGLLVAGLTEPADEASAPR